MKSRVTIFAAAFLAVLGIASCSNSQSKEQERQARLQEEYQKGISEGISSIQDKYDSLKEMYETMREENTDCAEYRNQDALPPAEVINLVMYLPEEAQPLSDRSEEFLVLYNPSKNGVNLNDIWWERVFGGDLYQRWINDLDWTYDTLKTEYRKERCLQKFNDEVVQPLQTAKYLLVVTDELFVEPNLQSITYNYESGYVFANVSIYDINTKELVDSFYMAADNSNHLEFDTEKYDRFSIDWNKAYPKLKRNLYERLRNNVINEAIEQLETY